MAGPHDDGTCAFISSANPTVHTATKSYPRRCISCPITHPVLYGSTSTTTDEDGKSDGAVERALSRLANEDNAASKTWTLPLPLRLLAWTVNDEVEEALWIMILIYDNCGRLLGGRVRF
jgi:hypothetical protein